METLRAQLLEIASRKLKHSEIYSLPALLRALAVVAFAEQWDGGGSHSVSQKDARVIRHALQLMARDGLIRLDEPSVD